jgi:hypothetical protein
MRKEQERIAAERAVRLEQERLEREAEAERIRQERELAIAEYERRVEQERLEREARMEAAR